MSRNVQKIRKSLIAGTVATIAVALTVAMAVSATASTPRLENHHKNSCVTFVVGFRTVTGHEADEMITVCGTGLKRDQYCELQGTIPFGAPGAKIACIPAKRQS